MVRTNVREFYGQTHHQWAFYHGGILAAISLCLSGVIASALIGSTYSYDRLHAWGSHPLLDPLWSTGAVRVVHDGAEASRMRKVEVIAREPAALRMLRVCGEQPDSEMNCGRCEKCLRTMVALQLLGRLEQCPTFPHRTDVDRIRRLDLGDSVLFWHEILDFPMDRKLRRTLESVVRTQEMGFGGDYGTWRSKARRTLALAKHMWGDLTAGLRMLRP